MKIKEVEERVGLTRSNIRFYEREGLLLIDRDQENNYRDYSEADVERIIKIKNLRMLGVPTADIKRLFADEISFDKVISDCMERIKEQERELKEIHRVCENMMQKQLDIHTWDGEIEADGKGVWKVRLEEIFSQDKIYEPIEQQKMNRSITVMLIFGYALNIVFSTILWPLYEKYQGYAGDGVPGWLENTPIGTTYQGYYEKSVHWNYMYMIIIASLVIVLICRAIVFYSDNVKIQFLVFVINSLLVSPVVLTLIQWYEDMLILYHQMPVLKFDAFTLGDIWMFWGMMIVYVGMVYLVSKKFQLLFVKKRYLLSLSAVISILYTFVYYVKCGYFFGPLVLFGVFLLFVSFSWLRVNLEQEKYSRYDSFTTANFIINPLGTFIQF